MAVTPRTERIATLCRAFEGALSPKQIGNLRWHHERNTPICCGPLGWYFIHEEAAAVEVLANTRRIKLPEDIDALYQETYIALVKAAGNHLLDDIYPRHEQPAKPLSDYQQAVLDSTPADVRKAITLVW